MAKNLLTSFLSLLLFAVAATTTTTTTTTATAQAKPKLAVFVVGVDDWKRGDVLAHIVGEELNRDKNYQVVTRSGAVQVKLKQLRRASGSVDGYDLFAWGIQHGVEHICLITTPDDTRFSAQLLDRSICRTLCSESSVSGGLSAVVLKELAWSLTLGLRSSNPNVCVAPCMVFVKGGTFTMGHLAGRDNAISDDGGKGIFGAFSAKTNVKVEDFWIGEHEVTQREWLAVMDTFPRYMLVAFRGDNRPMLNVTRNEVQDYLAKLNAKIANTGMVYKLPAEVQWEYAARGGSVMPKNCPQGCQFSGSNDIISVAVYGAGMESAAGPNVVKSKSANELGIYDMSGNVFEMCEDNWREDYNSTPDASRYVSRGGGWRHPVHNSRIAPRYANSDSDFSTYYGFRVVLVLP
jgi:formylglycine-generating enzyme required for sulfatase activity